MVPNKIKLSDFSYNIIKVLSGNILAGGVTFVALLVITRLFTAEHIGMYQLFLSLLTISGVLTTLRLELAVYSSGDRSDLTNITSFIMMVMGITVLVLGLVLYFSGEFFIDTFNAAVISGHEFVFILGFFFTGFVELLNNLMILQKRYTQYSKIKVLQTVFIYGGLIIGGLLMPNYKVMILTFLISLVLTSLVIIPIVRLEIKLPNKETISSLIKRFFKIPLFNAPLVFLNNLSLEIPVLMFTKYFSFEEVGFFMIANRLLGMPSTLIINTVAKVFFQEASVVYKNSNTALARLFTSTIKKILFVAVPVYVLIGILAPVLVNLFYGNEWADVAVIMQILSGVYVFRVFSSPTSTTLTIINKQEFGVLLTAVFLVIRILAMIIYRQTLFSMLLANAIVSCIFYLSYTLLILALIRKNN